MGTKASPGPCLLLLLWLMHELLLYLKLKGLHLWLMLLVLMHGDVCLEPLPEGMGRPRPPAVGCRGPFPPLPPLCPPLGDRGAEAVAALLEAAPVPEAP